MGSHSVTCHPTQANAPRLNPSERWYSIYLPQQDGRLSWPRLCPDYAWTGNRTQVGLSEVRRPITAAPERHPSLLAITYSLTLRSLKATTLKCQFQTPYSVRRDMPKTVWRSIENILWGIERLRDRDDVTWHREVKWPQYAQSPISRKQQLSAVWQYGRLS